MPQKGLLGLAAGGTFMIIDMGGGTVDMTIHKVDSVMGQEMALTEVTHRECLPEVRPKARMGTAARHRP